MSLFFTDAELSRLKNASPDSRQARLYAALRARTLRNTAHNAWCQPADTQEWYHLCWERMADAAFVYAVEGGQALGQWIRERTLETVRLDLNDWIGPWFRRRAGEPVGALETAHITLAVCEAYENARSLFTPDECAEIRDALRTKAQPLCRRFLRRLEERRHVNNWCMVLLCGYGTASVVLRDAPAVREAVAMSHITARAYNEDSYGETVQYSNYATLTLSHLNECILRAGDAEPAALELACYTGLMRWYAYSYLYQKPLPSLGCSVPRSFNFGDCAAAFRPSGDVLAQIAVRMKDAAPRDAALAAWLFSETYADPGAGPDELASFGFYNQYGYLTVLMEPDMAAAQSPGALDLPLSERFACGHIISRDRWDAPRAAVAIAAGYDPLCITDHRHADQNSFQLVVDGERMLTDPGHCCYRLHAQTRSRSELTHSTVSIERLRPDAAPGTWNIPDPAGLILQKPVEGSAFDPREPLNVLRVNERFGDTQIVVSDSTALYGAPLRKVLRIWVMTLPDKLFVADVVQADEPVTLWSHFSANNRDNALDAHVYNEHKLVLRRHGRAIKLFEALSIADGQICPSTLSFEWGYVHDYYHPQPNQAGQGREGSALIYNWRCPRFARSHLRIHTIAAAGSDTVRGYHVKEPGDGFVRIEAPDHADYVDLRLAGDHFTVRRAGVGERTWQL